MRSVFVMLKCEMGTAYKVARSIADEVAETREVHSISGEYDILAKFVVEEDSDIGRFVCERVQTLPSIVSTFTIVSLNPFSDDHFLTGRVPET